MTTDNVTSLADEIRRAVEEQRKIARGHMCSHCRGESSYRSSPEWDDEFLEYIHRRGTDAAICKASAYILATDGRPEVQG